MPEALIGYTVAAVAGCGEGTAELLKVDVIVLGAGIVGVSTAVHLLWKGLDVALVDRRLPGEETSSGTAGVIMRNAYTPLTVPSAAGGWLSVMSGRNIELRGGVRALWQNRTWLREVASFSTRTATQSYARAIDPLLKGAGAAHREIASAAKAEMFFNAAGTIHLFRSEATMELAEMERHYARIFGVPYEELSAFELNDLEPALAVDRCRALYWPDSQSVSNPGAVTKAYARYFSDSGGIRVLGDAKRLAYGDGGWGITSDRGPIWGRAAVVTLGPWSMDILAERGYDLPFGVTRGYSQHFGALSNLRLSRPVVDVEFGYQLTPSDRGVRLSTGTEIGGRDDPPTPVQMEHARRKAREIFPLGAAQEADAWMGCRPLLADSLPIIGPSPSESGLWFNFGHGALGFALGPVTGRVLADLVTGKKPALDLTAFSAVRFA